MAYAASGMLSVHERVGDIRITFWYTKGRMSLARVVKIKFTKQNWRAEELITVRSARNKFFG